MSVIGVGLDLCQVERMRRAVETPRFLQRAFTQGERARIAQKGVETAAGLFAAKEAVAKALGSGFDGFFLDKIEIWWDERGCPQCLLHGGARKRLDDLGGGRVLLSITHEAGLAAAVAVVESAGASPAFFPAGGNQPQAAQVQEKQ